ncbi:MAG TPA: fibro-slime domain-containing protein, partial [Polyangiaceae bacterium]|nr:fibro-slime domain-containing protein [Polyangiaceae bacterium]
MNQSAAYALVTSLVLTVACGTSSGAGGSTVRNNGAGTGAGAASGGGMDGVGDSSSAGSVMINVDAGPPVGGAGGSDGTSCNGALNGYIRDFLAADNQDFEPWTVTGPAGPMGMGFPNRYMPLKVDPAATIGMTPTTCPTGRPCLELGIVQPTLDMNRKPVYAKKADGSDSLTTTGQANFDTWFHDVAGKNLGMALPLQFTLDPTDPTGKTYNFDSRILMGGGFFPIDGLLLGPTTTPPNEGFPHNYSFTFELHTMFTYNKGAVFNFQGDDDVWVFINNTQVVDLGGIHDIGT